MAATQFGTLTQEQKNVWSRAVLDTMTTSSLWNFAKVTEEEQVDLAMLHQAAYGHIEFERPVYKTEYVKLMLKVKKELAHGPTIIQTT